MTKNVLQNYLDLEGRVKQWPAKFSTQEVILAYLIEKFEMERTYTEREVNDLLRRWHTFDDWAILRRALIDSGYMRRDLNGTKYERVQK